MTLDATKHRLGDAEHQRIFDADIRPCLFAGVAAQQRPVAVVFGGQPGSGKSAAVDMAVTELAQRGGAAQILGDEFRAFHPAFARLLAQDDKTAAFYTDQDTGRWVEKSIAYAAANRFNVVIEGTMRDGAKVAQTLASFRAAGYELDVRALAVKAELSWQGVLQRYEAQKADRGYGRMTAEHSHRDAYNGLPHTLERIERDRLADRVTLYKRGGLVVYENHLQGDRWRLQPGAVEALTQERERPMTLDERIAYAAGFDRLARDLASPQRLPTKQEVSAVYVLREQAHRSVEAEVFRTQGRESLTAYPALTKSYDVLDQVATEGRLQGLSGANLDALVLQARGSLAREIEQAAPAQQAPVARRSEPDRGR